MPTLHLDFETRSTVDLRKAGVYRYAQDPTTDVWCACFAVDEAPVQVWTPGQPVPDAWARACEEGWEVHAHNAQFERVVVNYLLARRYGWPAPRLEQWHCTAALAAAMAVPRSLEEALRVMGVPVQKDMEGYRLMMQMARPRKPTKDHPGLRWWDEPAKIERLIAYCKVDVDGERALGARLRKLSPTERAVYLHDQLINDRGIKLDTGLVNAARELTTNAQAMLNKELEEVTRGWVAAATKAKDLTAWLAAEGIEADSVAKPAVRAMLADPDTPKVVRRALEIRQEAAKSSTAKLSAMLAAVCADERVRGLLLYHGAGTGRWAGKLVQPQNFPRASAKDDVIAFILECADAALVSMLLGAPLAIVASLLRPCLIAADGHDLLAADYSNIEGRVTAWFAGETWKIQAFRDYDTIIGTTPDGKPERKGLDLYVLAYARSFSLDPSEVDDQKRQVGKVMELSMGFQGGVGAFQNMAANYGVKVPDEEADRLKRAWREAHPAVVQMWRDLEEAALDAVRRPGAVVKCLRGRIAFRVKGGFLWMILPSGRPLAYASPKAELAEMPWDDEKWEPCADEATAILEHGDALIEYDPVRRRALVRRPAMKEAVTFWGVDSKTRKWSKQKGYGGLWTENAVQATARDIMTNGMAGAERAGYPVVLTVHDEVVTEPPEGHGSVEDFQNIMCDLPAWAAGLPVAAAGWRGKRYRK